MITTERAASLPGRAVYAPLVPRRGYRHVLIADGEGAQALITLLTCAAEGISLAPVEILYTPGPDGVDQSAELATISAETLHRDATPDALLQRLQQILREACMGIQFYVAGSEALIGQVERDIMATGYPGEAIQKEHRGSTRRRVRCVHCKGITDNVAVEPVRCTHCGLHLRVRDQYSPRLAAFMGVCVDAEEPGSIPSAVVRFL